ncbi:NifB/NifX family molybdenum-iron cluster-binding protein [Maledivibacter halophilus]|uniref:Predicted Fe-Mo cluster-binding protein, NifX family n=1 Tax=Maledivibacter halophilus TaxID=36842 RepID=A0A1T5KHD6_9FIRM|nr:NifB/NifX family molybdenum-iron cluster-binding protein [Maledivibacter halophilus]SKC63127.1 Predicted Fe-Mo cluster-binding protein, NifX family [Maledivibacter halophilus]
MKVCITSKGKEKNSPTDLRFGRCKYFAIYDDETEEIEYIDNSSISANQGAGITAAQKIIDIGAGAVVTGKMGPNAMKIIEASNIDVYRFEEGTVEEAVKSFKENKLSKINTPVSAHSGLKN